MRKILVFSDTHRKDDRFKQVWDRERPCDIVICAGDSEGSEDTFKALTEPAEFHYARGNNDFFTDAPYDEQFLIGDRTVFLTHGHHYYVSLSEEILVEEALSRGASIAIYGHTHKPVIHEVSGILVMNPGSLGYPRQPGRLPSYIVMNLSNDGQLSYAVRYLD